MENSAVQHLLDNPDTTDKPPKEFKFNTALDEVGLPLESLDYAKNNCKSCYGRGYLSYLVGNGYKDGQQLQARNEMACHCVHKGYSKVRLAKQAELEVQKELASNYLNVSVEYLEKLVTEGTLPKDLNLEALSAYKVEKDKQTDEALNELTKLSQEYEYEVDKADTH